jgi:hypothetical protein
MSGIPHEHYTPKTGIERWLHSRLPVVSLVYDVMMIPTPKNLNWMWIWGIVLAFWNEQVLFREIPLEARGELEGMELESDDASGQQLLGVKRMADFVVRNDGGLDALRADVAGKAYTDENTRATILDVYERRG